MCVHVCVYMYVPMVSVKLALGEGGERELWEVFPTGGGKVSLVLGLVLEHCMSV